MYAVVFQNAQYRPVYVEPTVTISNNTITYSNKNTEETLRTNFKEVIETNLSKQQAIIKAAKLNSQFKQDFSEDELKTYNALFRKHCFSIN